MTPTPFVRCGWLRSLSGLSIYCLCDILLWRLGVHLEYWSCIESITQVPSDPSLPVIFGILTSETAPEHFTGPSLVFRSLSGPEFSPEKLHSGLQWYREREEALCETVGPQLSQHTEYDQGGKCVISISTKWTPHASSLSFSTHLSVFICTSRCHTVRLCYCLSLYPSLLYCICLTFSFSLVNGGNILKDIDSATGEGTPEFRQLFKSHNLCSPINRDKRTNTCKSAYWISSESCESICEKYNVERIG